MKKKRLIGYAQAFASDMNSMNIATYAGSATFFFVMSLIPMLITFCALLPYTPVTRDDLISVAFVIFPDFTHNFMRQIITEAYRQSASMLTFAAIVTIWSGATGMMALLRGLNYMDGVWEKRNYFHVRFIASLYTLAMLVVILIALVAYVFGESLVSLTLAKYPELEPVTSTLIHLRYLVSTPIGVLAFSGMYAYLPNRRKRFFSQVPGALFTTVAWAIFSSIFGIYVDDMNPYTLYGSLSTPVIIMFWLYMCLFIFFIGAFINHFLPGVLRRRKEDSQQQ